MKIAVQVAERAMIGAVLRPAIEALPVGSPVRRIDAAVNCGVRPVIAFVLTRLRRRGRDRGRNHKRCNRH